MWSSHFHSRRIFHSSQGYCLLIIYIIKCKNENKNKEVLELVGHIEEKIVHTSNNNSLSYSVHIGNVGK